MEPSIACPTSKGMISLKFCFCYVHVYTFYIFYFYRDGHTMGATCNKLLEPEDVSVGATVGKWPLSYIVCTCKSTCIMWHSMIWIGDLLTNLHVSMKDTGVHCTYTPKFKNQ